MAEGLTIAGIPVAVIADSWVEQPSVYQGARVRLSDNNIFDSSRDRMRVAECQAYFFAVADEDTLRAACPRGTPVAIAGELPGTGFSGVVDFGTATSLRVFDADVQVLHRLVTLHIEQAIP